MAFDATTAPFASVSASAILGNFVVADDHKSIVLVTEAPATVAVAVKVAVPPERPGFICTSANPLEFVKFDASVRTATAPSTANETCFVATAIPPASLTMAFT